MVKIFGKRLDFKQDRMIKVLMLVALYVLITGIPLLIAQETSTQRPDHLEPYPGNTDGLDLVIVYEDIQICILRTSIYTMDPHFGPTTMGCSLTIEVSNNGTDEIVDFTPTTGTVFRPRGKAIYSFLAAFYGPGVPIDIDPIPAFSSAELYCADMGSYKLSDSEFDRLPESAYVRIQFQYQSNVTFTLTSPLTWISHAVE